MDAGRVLPSSEELPVPAKKQTVEVDVMKVAKERVYFYVLGTSPLICNAMSEKVRQELLLPGLKPNKAEKASRLKHNPLLEFRNSMYKDREPNGPTRVVLKSTSFKGALMSAALDIPGSTKAQIGRLAYVVGDQVAIYGVPKLFMAVTRSADMNRTPDVRTRAILPKWCCKLTVEYATPILKDKVVTNLLAAAGMTQGVGDWRVQKGSGNYGQFELVAPDNADFRKLVATAGRAAQDAAIQDPETYDDETDTLLSWFRDEAERRGFKEVV